MVSIEETEIMLNEIAEELPIEFYEKLNGGILVLPEEKLHPKNQNNDLYILGEYHYTHNMGRYIVIYYGSFMHVHGQLNREQFREKLRQVLVHEFTHHLESLAGERNLEAKDAQNIRKYLAKTEKK